MLLSEVLSQYLSLRDEMLTVVSELDTKLREQGVTSANRYVVFDDESYFSEVVLGKIAIYPKDNPSLVVLVDQ